MNLLVIAASRVDSTSYYRTYGTFRNLREVMKSQGHDLNIIPGDNINITWAELQLADVVMMQRPSKPGWDKLAEYIKDMNLPLWVEYDDDIFHITEDSQAFFHYKDPEVLKSAIKIIKLADVVTVTTKALQKTMSEFNDNVQIVKNTLNMNLLDSIKKNNNLEFERDKPVAMWRGSSFHQADLMALAPELSGLSREFKDWIWFFWGYNPWFIKTIYKGKNIAADDSVDVIQYHKRLKAIKPELVHVPLQNHPFNHAKSNIAGMEATWAGCPVIVPDWEEWQVPGWLKYRDAKGYRELIRAVIKKEIDIEKRVKTAWDYICENYDMNTENHKRSDILTGLVG